MTATMLHQIWGWVDFVLEWVTRCGVLVNTQQMYGQFIGQFETVLCYEVQQSDNFLKSC